MTQILRAETGADFLALVPTLAGFTPHNSLVCVMFAGKRSNGALRLDLPSRRRTAEYRAVANAAVAIAARNHGTDRLAFVVYTDSSFDAEQGIPWLEFARLCMRQADRAGFHVTGSFCVADDGWGSYLNPDQPRTGIRYQTSSRARSSNRPRMPGRSRCQTSATSSAYRSPIPRSQRRSRRLVAGRRMCLDLGRTIP